MIEHDRDAHRLDGAHLLHQLLARQPVGGDAEMQHPPGQGAGLVDLDRVAQPRQVVGRGQAARTGADHEDALAARLRVDRQRATLRAPPCRRGSAPPHGSKPRCRSARDCSGSRRGGSRPVHARRAAGCRAPASATPRDGDRPAHAPATPGCSLRPGRRCYTAARDRRRSDAARAPVPCPALRRGR